MDDARIREKNEEIKNSFEAIGNSVSEAFKGMLTGAMSWKDGMRSIIGSVIDQLWKLFVVQQIVGLVTKAFGGTSSMPGNMGTAGDALKLVQVPGFANGTQYAPGGMALVGERGPELVNLPRGSQVIPNHKMRGGSSGGINITVDARGSNDPAAVRAQVQQGILEAAPAIIAAAESRTIAGLRRPRLGGAMQ
jgi:phage-related minor tail protein